MKRLIYSTETQKLLEDLAVGDKYYWRYQDKEFNGLIPAGHKSNERVYDGESPEFIEDGCSCYDNPFQLLKYMDDVNILNIKNYDVVLFVGSHKGYGMDNEDIVMVEDETDIMYSLSAKDFFKFCVNADIDILDHNLKNYCEDFTDEFLAVINNK